jgi:hypothetical protein
MIAITIQRDGVPFAEITAVHTGGGGHEHAVTVWTYTPEGTVRAPAGVVVHNRSNGPWDLVSGVVTAALDAVWLEGGDAEC